MRLNEYYNEKLAAGKCLYQDNFDQQQQAFTDRNAFQSNQSSSHKKLRISHPGEQDQKQIESLSPSRNLSTQGDVFDQDQIVEQKEFQTSERQEEPLKNQIHAQQQPYNANPYTRVQQTNYQQNQITQPQYCQNHHEQQPTQEDQNSKQNNLTSRNYYNEELSNNSQFANSQHSCNPSTARIANITPSRMFVYPQQTFPTGASVHSSTQNYQKLVHHHHGPSRSTSTRAIEQLSQAIAYQLQAENNNSHIPTISERQKLPQQQHQLEDQQNPLTNKLLSSNYSSADNKRKSDAQSLQNVKTGQSVNEDQFMLQMASFHHKMEALLRKKDEEQNNLQEDNEIKKFQLSPQHISEFKRDNHTRVGVLRYDNLQQAQYQRSGATLQQQTSNLYKDSQIASPRQLANSATSSSVTRINEFNALSQDEKQELLKRIAKFSNN